MIYPNLLNSEHSTITSAPVLLVGNAVGSLYYRRAALEIIISKCWSILAIASSSTLISFGKHYNNIYTRMSVLMYMALASYGSSMFHVTPQGEGDDS